MAPSFTSILVGGLAMVTLTVTVDARAQVFKPVTQAPSGDRFVSYGAVGPRFIYGVARGGAKNELRATDGTSDVAIMEEYSSPGYSGISASHSVGVVGGKLLFHSGSNLWATGGTVATTFSLHAGSYEMYARRVGPNSAWLFDLEYASKTWRIWHTDGSAAKTTKVAEFAGSKDYGPRFATLGKLTFFTVTAPYGNADVGLWVYDGASKTRLLQSEEINFPMTCGPYVYVHSRLAIQTNPQGWWRTDGTVAGTTFVSASNYDESPTCLSGKFLFVAGYTELKVASATGVATIFSSSNPSSLRSLDKRALFQTSTPGPGTTYRYDLYATDGTAANTVSIQQSDGPFDTYDMTESGVALGTTHDALLLTDGSASGTATIPGTTLEHFESRTARHDGKIYFWGKDGAHGREPWVTDGTLAGTHLMEDVRPGPESSAVESDVDSESFYVADGQLFTCADDGVHGRQVVATRIAPSTLGSTPDGGPSNPGNPSGAGEPGATGGPGVGPDADGSTEPEDAAPDTKSTTTGCAIAERSPRRAGFASVVFGLALVLARKRSRRSKY